MADVQSDPQGLFDLIMLWTGSTLLAVTLVLALYMVYRRDYEPIKAKGAGLTLLSTAAGALWWFSGLVVNSSIANTGVFVWIHTVFGYCTWVSALIWRLYQLNIVFNLNLKPQTSFVGGVPLLLIPAMLFSAAASLSGAVEYNEGAQECFYSTPTWTIATAVVYLGYAGAHLMFAWRLRHINDTFNEYTETRNMGIVLLLAFLGLGALWWFSLHLTLWARLLISFVRLAAVLGYFHVRNFQTVYMCVFHEKQYLKVWRFRHELIDEDDTRVAIVDPKDPWGQRRSVGNANLGLVSVPDQTTGFNTQPAKPFVPPPRYGTGITPVASSNFGDPALVSASNDPSNPYNMNARAFARRGPGVGQSGGGGADWAIPAPPVADAGDGDARMNSSDSLPAPDHPLSKAVSGTANGGSAERRSIGRRESTRDLYTGEQPAPLVGSRGGSVRSNDPFAQAPPAPGTPTGSVAADGGYGEAVRLPPRRPPRAQRRGGSFNRAAPPRQDSTRDVYVGGIPPPASDLADPTARPKRPANMPTFSSQEAMNPDAAKRNSLPPQLAGALTPLSMTSMEAAGSGRRPRRGSASNREGYSAVSTGGSSNGSSNGSRRRRTGQGEFVQHVRRVSDDGDGLDLGDLTKPTEKY